ncbi:FAD/NAD-P-binding domain-containing protein [Dentipellis sp. KUC8613]|nr:FAD/NAD-P-binding domain-containing protein [Dentipellis sp. KUC8613]
MTAPAPTKSKKHVVVVGGGGAGSMFARRLSRALDASQHELTVINARPFNIYLPSTPRMAVTAEDNFEDKVLVPFDRLLAKGVGQVKIGRVVGVEPADGAGKGGDGKAGGRGGEVVLEDGERVRYDALVLAPGMRWSGPLDFPDSKDGTLAHIREWRNKFAKADKIVMAGGGPVNIGKSASQLAGELKYYFPNKSVTIVQSGDLPLNKVYAPRFRRAVDVRIRARGVELVFGEYLDETAPKDGVVTTRSGRKIPADLVVSSTGGTPATDFLSNIVPSILTPSGRVRTEPTLQVTSHPDIFCIGDVVETEERPSLGKYKKHSQVVCANVLARLRDDPAKAVYKGSIESIGITMGKTGGAGYLGILWGLVSPNWLIWLAKARTLGTRAARFHMGYGIMDSLRGTPLSESVALNATATAAA